MASTIKDIKSETGLALATISKYLNGGNVRTENREKIEAAIKKLDYRPNEMARAFFSASPNLIVFVTSYLKNAPFAAALPIYFPFSTI